MSTNDFKCQQYYPEDYINSAHDFEVDCSNQNTSYTACILVFKVFRIWNLF